MILGISSFAYAWSIGVEGNVPAQPMNEADLVEKTLQVELRCLQIGDNLPIHQFAPDRIENLNKLIQKNDIRLEIGARKLTPEHLNRYIELSTFFNSPLLRFVIDGDNYEPNRSTIIGIIRDALPLLAKHNLILGIENHDRFKATELASIMEAIGNEQVGICLDCVNSLGAGEGLDWTSQVLAPYTVNLHIKDFRIQRLPHKMGFLVTGSPAGDGMTNVPRLLENLSRYNRCKSAVLEQWVEPEKYLEDTIGKEDKWAQAGIKYLAQLPQFKTDRPPNGNVRNSK